MRSPGLKITGTSPATHDPWRTDGDLSQASRSSRIVRGPAADCGPQAVSARADARAPVPLLPRLRRVREEPAPGRGAAPAPHARAVLRGGRRVRRAGGVDPRRRAAAAPADRRDRAG